MTRTQIYLPEETLLEAKLQAQLNNINLSQYIRDAIKDYSKKTKTKSKSAKNTKLNYLLKNIKSGVGDSQAAKNHNDIYKQNI